MNAAETEQAGMQTAVGRDCVERVPSSTRERLDIICGARSGACRDGRRAKSCPSSVTRTGAVPR
jgi:hypothetical protein